jgi:hypothetical protein
MALNSPRYSFSKINIVDTESHRLCVLVIQRVADSPYQHRYEKSPADIFLHSSLYRLYGELSTL